MFSQKDRKRETESQRGGAVRPGPAALAKGWLGRNHTRCLYTVDAQVGLRPRLCTGVLVMQPGSQTRRRREGGEEREAGREGESLTSAGLWRCRARPGVHVPPFQNSCREGTRSAVLAFPRGRSWIVRPFGERVLAVGVPQAHVSADLDRRVHLPIRVHCVDVRVQQICTRCAVCVSQGQAEVIFCMVGEQHRRADCSARKIENERQRVREAERCGQARPH